MPPPFRPGRTRNISKVKHEHSILDGQAGDPLQERRNALAKTAAILAADAIAPAEASASVTYRSSGRLLVVGTAVQALPRADLLAASLPVTAVLLDGEGELAARAYPVLHARAIAVAGWLGAFEARWQAPGQAAQQASFDLVLDLCPSPLISSHQHPHGYYAPGPDEAARRAAASELLDMIGDFEKPKYFSYKERLCAHSRNERVGCNACVEICSAKAISGNGDRIKVNPYLCAGCGACTTVCRPAPSATTSPRPRTLAAASRRRCAPMSMRAARIRYCCCTAKAARR
ncbi:hypothetical protein [Massilia sp. Se16.2.3]|uniref:hypothetical protein n=1 Tax=Massilia sp. Se16.2.3 TaxID=2709303 RepID=UPI001E45AAED|nr:hypothetical protein [Massilia sp. Se16.2.3]